MTHAPHDLLTPFDLRGHIFRVDVEFTTYSIDHVNNPSYDLTNEILMFIFRVVIT